VQCIIRAAAKKGEGRKEGLCFLRTTLFPFLVGLITDACLLVYMMLLPKETLPFFFCPKPTMYNHLLGNILAKWMMQQQQPINVLLPHPVSCYSSGSSLCHQCLQRNQGCQGGFTKIDERCFVAIA
jgi:hypothetical protein